MKYKYTTEEKQKIIGLYKTGLSSIKIGKRLGINQGVIIKMVRSSGEEIRSKRHPKYIFNENVFDKVNTEEKAYWTGFIMADGCVFKNKLILTLSSKDIDRLEKFKSFLKASHPIFIRKVKFNGSYQSNDCCVFTVCSAHMINALKKLGITERKTFTCKPPNLKPILKKHFLRGLFDGDGWTSLSKKGQTGLSINTGICGNTFVINWFSSILKVLKIPHKIDSHKTIFRIQFKGYRAFKFLHWLYKGSNIFMQRKFDNFLLFINYLNGNKNAIYCKTFQFFQTELASYK